MEMNKVGMIKQNWIIKETYENNAKNNANSRHFNLRNEIYESTYDNLFRNVNDKVLLTLSCPGFFGHSQPGGVFDTTPTSISMSKKYKQKLLSYF